MTNNPAASAAFWPAALAQAALDATSNLMLVLDAAGTVQHANPAACALLGLRRDELVGRSFASLLDAGSQRKGARLLEAARPQEGSAVFELNHVSARGDVEMIAYRAVRLLPGKEGESAVLLVGEHTAPRVATTERLIALNRRLSALLSITTTSSRSLVLHDLLEQVLDVTVAELGLRAGAIYLDRRAPEGSDDTLRPPQAGQLQLEVQRGFAPAFVERLGQIQAHPMLWHADARAEQQFVRSGLGDKLGIAAADLEHTSGPLLHVAGTPLVSETKLVGWLIVVSDQGTGFSPDELELLRTIGNVLGPPVENARLYDALLQTSGQLHAVLEGIDSGVMLVDEHGTVRYANPRLGELLGVDVVGWAGRSRDSILPVQLVPLAQQSFLEGEFWRMEGVHSRVLRRTAAPVTDRHGTPLGSIEVWSDVTQVIDMNRLRDEFVAAAAHDLKTPVTAVKGYAQIALRMARKLDDERLIRQLGMINARSDELAALMDALLDMSRMQAGRLQLHVEPVLIASLIDRTLKHFEFDVQRQRRSIVVDLPAAPIEVVWDRPRIESVLINLVGNALKYSPEGGDITLRVRCVDGEIPEQVEISITDRGIGIPPAERERIFDRFYRVPQAAAQGFKGTGIGLYISQHIVALHGGRIWAADALHGGRGTTVFLLLPRVSHGSDE